MLPLLTVSKPDSGSRRAIQGRRLDEAAARELEEETGIKPASMEQLYTFLGAAP